MAGKVKSVLILIGVIWGVMIVNTLIFGMSLNHTLGLLPRTFHSSNGGLVGIIFSPFLHGSFSHLISNTVPLFILLSVSVVFYEKITLQASGVIIVLGGLLVWVFGREAVHIGASGLIFGLAGFLILSGLFRRDLKSIAISLMIGLIYGVTMLFGVLPGQKGISWEGHLFGALAGGVAAYLYRKEEISGDHKPVSLGNNRF